MIVPISSIHLVIGFFVQMELLLKMIEEEKILLSFILLSLKRCAKVFITFKKDYSYKMTGQDMSSKQKE
jgi:hypothetical protein